MNDTRQDAWTKEEDVILAETVLNFIRQGKTQLEAFKEVANQLSRTPAACGFRWNATIRKQHQLAIQTAKEERKSGLKRSAPNQHEEETPSRHTIDSAILLLEKMKSAFPEQQTDGDYEKRFEIAEKENERLRRQLERYDNAWEEMNKLWAWVKEAGDQ